ncbi:molybdenum cofactor guanylyltransferase MobA [Wenxinia saemankumensis]|nr:molybdenum cofactor guanylyltransferase MobA [Wenxinia saemankumensis]
MRQPPGVILAGGAARRLGGDKAGALLRGRPLLAHVADRIAPQVAALAVNGDPGALARFGLPVLPDPLPGRPGPLAGLLAAMDWAAERGDRWVLTVPCDTPFLPPDLVPRLILAGDEGTRPAVAAAGGRAHPVIGLWPARLAGALRAALGGDMARMRDWSAEAGAVEAPFPDPASFANVNTPGDLAALEGG